MSIKVNASDRCEKKLAWLLFYPSMDELIVRVYIPRDMDDSDPP